MTTCPDCGKAFADNGLHLCAAGNWYTGDAPAMELEIRSGNVSLPGESFGPPTLTSPAMFAPDPKLEIRGNATGGLEISQLAPSPA